MATQSFDPGKFALNISGVLISGFDDGTFVEVARTTDSADVKVSADGKESCFVHRRNKSGTMTITLLASAGANSYIDGLRQLQESGNLDSFPVGIDDGLNTEIFSAAACIKTLPTYGYGTDGPTRQWTLVLAEIDYIVTPQTTAWATIKNTISDIVTSIFD